MSCKWLKIIKKKKLYDAQCLKLTEPTPNPNVTPLL